MAYDEGLARCSAGARRRPGISEQRMFGGLRFLMKGTCCGGVPRCGMVRVGKEPGRRRSRSRTSGR